MALVLVAALAGCAPASGTKDTATSVEPSVSGVGSASPSASAEAFPTVALADLSEVPVTEETAAGFQAVLDEMAGKHVGSEAAAT